MQFMRLSLAGIIFLTALVALTHTPAQAQTLNLTGTQVHTANDNQFVVINAYDSSTLNVVDGGSVDFAQGYNTSKINISGGYVYSTNGKDTSEINIRGGIVDYALVSDTSTTNISGGSVTEIYGYNDSVFNITGGTIGQNAIYLFGNSVLNITGTGLSFSPGVADSDFYGSYTRYILGGTLQGGQSITGVVLRDYDDGGASLGDPNAGTGNLRFFASVAAPEPATLALLLPFAVGIFARRKIQRNRL